MKNKEGSPIKIFTRGLLIASAITAGSILARETGLFNPSIQPEKPVPITKPTPTPDKKVLRRSPKESGPSILVVEQKQERIFTRTNAVANTGGNVQVDIASPDFNVFIYRP
ncbi:hypothetical protein HYT02_03370 [Candidatus Gottesmanbacteria bacterium]|nr:hypothetical protein [Candidatus Gottesmanbacteria bacterium]